MTEEPRRAVRVRISGRVQGVGFRYFTVRAARRLAVAGRVRNLPDGSVEVEAAGEAPALERFLAELEHGPPGSRVLRLERTDLREAPPWKDFDVAFL
jgi:acylphosphatase